MATTTDLNDDLSVGMTEVRWTLEHYNIGEWQEYLLVRKRGHPDAFIVLQKERDTSDFADKLVEFHKAQAAQEASNGNH